MDGAFFFWTHKNLNAAQQEIYYWLWKNKSAWSFHRVADSKHTKKKMLERLFIVNEVLSTIYIVFLEEKKFETENKSEIDLKDGEEEEKNSGKSFLNQ